MHKARCIVVRCAKQLDTLNIIPKEMKLDCLEAECLWLATCRFQRFLRCLGGLRLTSLGIFGICLHGLELSTGNTHKVPQAHAQGCCSDIKEVEGCFSMYVQFGQSVPCCKRENKVKDGRVVRFGQEAFQTWDNALFGSRLAGSDCSSGFALAWSRSSKL